MLFPDQLLFCSEYFWRGIFQFFYRQNKCKLPSASWAIYLLNTWSGQIDFCIIPRSFVSPLVSFTSLCAAVTAPCLLPSSAALKTSHPAFLFSSSILWQAVGLCSRSTDTIAFIALSITPNFLCLFKGEKSHPSGYDFLSISWTCELDFACCYFPFCCCLVLSFQKRCRKGAASPVRHHGSKCHLVLMAVKCSPLVTIYYCYNTLWHMESSTKADVLGRENLTNLKVKSQSDMFFPGRHSVNTVWEHSKPAGNRWMRSWIWLRRLVWVQPFKFLCLRASQEFGKLAPAFWLSHPRD